MVLSSHRLQESELEFQVALNSVAEMQKRFKYCYCLLIGPSSIISIDFETKTKPGPLNFLQAESIDQIPYIIVKTLKAYMDNEKINYQHRYIQGELRAMKSPQKAKAIANETLARMNTFVIRKTKYWGWSEWY